MYDVSGLGARGSPGKFSAGSQDCRPRAEIEKARPEQEAQGRADFSSTITPLSKTTKSTPGVSRPGRNEAKNYEAENLPVLPQAPKSTVSERDLSHLVGQRGPVYNSESSGNPLIPVLRGSMPS